jgi:hypothetical protein
VGGFAQELHGAGAESPQGLEGYRAKRTSGASVLCLVVPALVSVPQNGSADRGASSGAKVRNCKRMHEQDIGEHLARATMLVALGRRAVSGMPV